MKKYTNIAAVWMKKDKNDNWFISFKAERDIKSGESINLFKSDKKGNEKRPDYTAYTVEESEDTNDSEQAANDFEASITPNREPTPF